MNDKTIRHLQENIERCHRLARATTDEGVIKALLEMAAEKEADLAQMLAERTPKVSTLRTTQSA